MEISSEMVRSLREKTGCGMMECKSALNESKGDLEQAIDILRKKGMASVARRAGRAASQGLVESYIHTGGKIGVLVEVNCETDFVARTGDFQAFVKDICMQIAASAPQYVNRDQVPDEMVEHEAEICLLDQPYIKDPKVKISDLLTAIAAKTGENVVIARFSRFQLGENKS